MNHNLTLSQKLCVLTSFLLLAVMILSFLPISYTNSYYYTDHQSTTECSILDQGFLAVVFLVALMATLIMHLLIALGEKGPEKFVFYPVAVILLLFMILCIKILVVHDSYHDQDGMYGIGLIGGLLACVGILSAVVQFRKKTAQ